MLMKKLEKYSKLILITQFLFAVMQRKRTTSVLYRKISKAALRIFLIPADIIKEKSFINFVERK